MCPHLACDQDLTNPLGIFCRNMLWRRAPLVERVCHAARLVHVHAVGCVVDGQSLREVRAQWITRRQRLVSRVLNRCSHFGLIAQVLGQQQVVFTQAPRLRMPCDDAVAQRRRRRARQHFPVCRKVGILQ